MPKKPAKNGYLFFMLDYKEREERRGKKFPGGLPQVSNECSHLWQKLNPSEKAKYAERAKQSSYTGSGPKNEPVKYTSLGIPIKAMEREKNIKKEEEKKAKQSIDNIIDLAAVENRLNTLEFCVMACNYFCKISNGSYIPAEIAVLKFSLQEGIIDVYHSLVNPGSLPLGMAYTAKLYSDETHRLPPPPNAEGEIFFTTIFQEFYDFIYDNEKQQLRPLFTHSNQLDACKSILNLFAAESDQDGIMFNVLNIVDLLFLLKKSTAKCQNADGFPTPHIAEAMIDRDQYEFHLNLGCEKHEELETPKFCSLSQVKRYAYTICDHCCLDIGVPLVSGKHIPLESVVPVDRSNITFDYDDEYDDDRKSDAYTFASSSKFSTSDFGVFHRDKGARNKHSREDRGSRNNSYGDRNKNRSKDTFPDFESTDNFNDTSRFNDTTRMNNSREHSRTNKSNDSQYEYYDSDSRDNSRVLDGSRIKKEKTNKWSRTDRVPESSFASTSKKDHDFYSFLK